MSRNIYRLLKILHLIGLSLFLGSIFGHIVASVLGGAPQAGSESAFLASRRKQVMRRHFWLRACILRRPRAI